MADTPRRFLIVRLSAIGDVVRTLPALEALRAAEPDAHIAWLVEDRARSVVAGHPALDGVYVYERRKISHDLRRPWRWRRFLGRVLTLLTDLRRRPYDVVLDFQSLVKSGLLTWATGAPVRVGFVREHCRERWNAWFTNAKVDPGDARLPRVQRNLEFIRHFSPAELHPRKATWYDTPEAEDWADEVLAHVGGRAPILLHPGTSRQRKAWWPSCWAAVGDTLREELDAPVLVTWGPGERDQAEAVAEHMWGPVEIAPETPTLHHLVSLIRRGAVFITVDSGPMHLAALTDTPVVGVFGPVDVQVNQPTTERMRCVSQAGVFGPGDALPEVGGSMHLIRASDVIAAALALVRAPAAVAATS